MPGEPAVPTGAPEPPAAATAGLGDGALGHEALGDEALGDEALGDEALGDEALAEEAAGEALLADPEVEEAERVLADDLDRLQNERNEYLDQLLRTKADFENYRKRIIKQQTEHLERAAEGLVEKLLDVFDTFDLALRHGEGFEQVHAGLMGVLQKEGLEKIDPTGRPFDPNEADAVAHEDGDGGPVVTEVLRPGYRWKGRVLRPAMVKVRG